MNDFYRPGGCQDQVLACSNQTVEERASNPVICSSATSFCRSNVEGPYYDYGERGVYGKCHKTFLLIMDLARPRIVPKLTHCSTDIRHPYDDPTPPDYFVDFLNLASTQEALGVNINYTSTSSNSVGRGFASTGTSID